MNKLNITLVFAFLFSFNLLIAQEHKDDDNDYHSDSRFSILVNGGIGFASIDNDNQPNYNLNANIADILVNYRIGKRIGISTGLGFTRLSGTGFNSTNQNFYHERGTLKIPLLLTTNYNLSSKIRMVAHLGFYAQTITRDEYSFANTTVKDIYEGWNFGIQSGLGLAYNIHHKLSIGIMFNSQGDFTRFESTTNAGFNDEQKITGINTLGLLFSFQL